MGLTDEFSGVMPGIITKKFRDGEWHNIILNVPREESYTLIINGHELMTINCTPSDIYHLIVGYLYGERIIASIKDIVFIDICEESSTANVRLKNSNFTVPNKKILTSGFCGGIVFNDNFSGKINSELFIEPDALFSLMKSMLKHAKYYQKSGGIHASALCTSEEIIIMSEDIGRHNTIVKIIGECILKNISTNDKILITTGRISTEMLQKALRLKIPIVASLSSPTDKAIKFAKEYNIKLLGYVRNDNMTLYS